MTTKMTLKAAKRIQKATAIANGGKVTKDSFVARAMKAVSASKTPPNGPSKTGRPSGKGRGNNPPKS